MLAQARRLWNLDWNGELPQLDWRLKCSTRVLTFARQKCGCVTQRLNIQTTMSMSVELSSRAAWRIPKAIPIHFFTKPQVWKWVVFSALTIYQRTRIPTNFCSFWSQENYRHRGFSECYLKLFTLVTDVYGASNSRHLKSNHSAAAQNVAGWWGTHGLHQCRKV